MFGGLLNNNPSAMIQISSIVLDEMGRPLSQGQPNPINNILQNLLNPQGRTGQPNVNTNVTNTTTTTTNVSNTTTNNTTTNQESNVGTNNTQTNTNVDILDQYPILRPTSQHINNLGNIVNEITGGNNNNIPILPNHSYPRNILAAIAIILKNWTNQMSRFIPYVTTLAEGLERESLLTNIEHRNKLQELARKVNAGLNEISQSCSSLQQTMNGLNVGTGPGLGYTTLLHNTINSVSIVSPNTNNIQQNNPQTNTTSTNQPQQTNQPQTNTQSEPRNNPLNQVLSQLNQPGGLQNMMSMVGSLLNNPNGGGNNIMNMLNSVMGGGGSNPNVNNQINSLLNSLINNEPDQQMEEPENVEEIIFENIV
jgi:hypothetical protein